MDFLRTGTGSSVFDPQPQGQYLAMLSLITIWGVVNTVWFCQSSKKTRRGYVIFLLKRT